MPVANPDYNPDWEAIHDYHDEHRSRLVDEMDPYYKQLDSGDDKFIFRELKQQYKFHHSTCLHILMRLQHKTVQDFAKWIFESSRFRLDISTVPPYEEFQSMEEVLELYKSLDDEHERKMEEQNWPRPRSTTEDAADSYRESENLINFRPSIWERVVGVFH